MREDLFGKIPEHEIVKIAWEAAEKRRIEGEEIAKKKDKQMRLDGTVEPVPVCRGYAVYSDFAEYFKQKMKQLKLELFNWDAAEVRFEIKRILCEVNGWEHERGRGRRKTRFYAPA